MAFKPIAKAAHSIRLLDELKAVGFDDEAFAALHHFSVKEGRNGDTIAAHRAYLLKLGDRNVRAANERVQDRLNYVLREHKKDSSKSFLELAKASTEAFPFRESDYAPGGGKYGQDSDD